MKHWFDWLFAPKEDMPTTFLIGLNYLIIEAIIKVFYDVTIGIIMRLLDRVKKSKLSDKVKSKVFGIMQYVVFVISVLCFVVEIGVLIYFVVQFIYD